MSNSASGLFKWSSLHTPELLGVFKFTTNNIQCVELPKNAYQLTDGRRVTTIRVLIAAKCGPTLNSWSSVSVWTDEGDKRFFTVLTGCYSTEIELPVGERKFLFVKPENTETDSEVRISLTSIYA